MGLTTVVYASAARVPFSAEDLVALLTKARTNNATRNISGVLLFSNGSFLQVLEGEAAQVDETFERIRRDERHDRLLILDKRPITERRFGEWTMGYVGSTLELKRLPGLNDFLQTGILALQGDRKVVERVLTSFRDGQFRQFVQG